MVASLLYQLRKDVLCVWLQVKNNRRLDMMQARPNQASVELAGWTFLCDFLATPAGVNTLCAMLNRNFL